ncbi:hypothetical protein NQZ68_000478 [Dissostichus eleginoides]|nr:hypothetical protein NQZ68_000478 [Dissostichus eleginoides]
MGFSTNSCPALTGFMPLSWLFEEGIRAMGERGLHEAPPTEETRLCNLSSDLVQ